MNQWQWKRHGSGADEDPVGPLTVSQLREMARTQAISLDDLLRPLGTDRWYRATSVKGLFPKQKREPQIAFNNLQEMSPDPNPAEFVDAYTIREAEPIRIPASVRDPVWDSEPEASGIPAGEREVIETQSSTDDGTSSIVRNRLLEIAALAALGMLLLPMITGTRLWLPLTWPGAAMALLLCGLAYLSNSRRATHRAVLMAGIAVSALLMALIICVGRTAADLANVNRAAMPVDLLRHHSRLDSRKFTVKREPKGIEFEYTQYVQSDVIYLKGRQLPDGPEFKISKPIGTETAAVRLATNDEWKVVFEESGQQRVVSGMLSAGQIRTDSGRARYASQLWDFTISPNAFPVQGRFWWSFGFYGLCVAVMGLLYSTFNDEFYELYETDAADDVDLSLAETV